MSRSVGRLRSSGEGPRAARPTTPGEFECRNICCTTSTRRRSWPEAVHDRPTPGHIGIVVDARAAASAFFAALGLELEGEASVEGGLVDRINGLEGVRADIVMLRTPDGNAKVELAKYRSPAYESENGPAPANAPGIRHILFVVDDIGASLAGLREQGGELVGELVNYENSYWLCYVRGAAGIIVELAEK